MSSRSEDSWPDWRGETAIIVGTGPSASDETIEIVRGKARVFVIKNSWRLAPWADALYGCDRGWWIANRGCAEFAGSKFSPSPAVCKVWRDLRQVSLKSCEVPLMGATGVVGCGLRSGGGFSGFQAMNLAMQFGAKRLVLVGFDMGLVRGAHWHKDYRGVAKPEQQRMTRWRAALDGAAASFAGLGVEVLNASMGSALQKFQKRSLWEIFR